ncbi:FBP domain-containing protein [Nakamurella aerolata]|uniref:FBP domain-containing protein n=1 Tax=Nakamurella aerolata TaxID=1656892 RepID=A0A849ACG7_9ACTN|nr:FBP domain-containing protein [Nakamurella aerolata]NNG37607.1 FBP domain-containing protein [Nakamurella aerolata]
MHALTQKDVLASFVNTTLRERKQLTFPDDFSETPWQERDFYGCRDAKLPLVGYVVIPLGDDLVGVMVRRSEQPTRGRTQCVWCNDVTLPNDVTFFSARRSGAAGRNGGTVGTLVCDAFQCSVNVRAVPPASLRGLDPERARQDRIERLRENLTAFARNIRDGKGT